MTNSKTTRKALLSSALALLMCVAMLIATTFAWFTDTASTSVNKIQAGTLDVALYYDDGIGADGNPNWVSAEGKTLGWMQKTTADGKATMVTEANKPLWEPGCTYSLPALKIVNNGNLALKYKIAITGIQGSAKLNDVIDWTIANDADATKATDLATTEYHLTAKDTDNDSDILTIKGHMQETAGNDYQNESIDGINITVYATQDTAEFDSSTNQYDVSAMYPLMPAVDVNVTKSVSVDADSKITEAVKLSGSTLPKGTILYTSHSKTDANKLTTEAISGGELNEKIETTSASTNEMTVSINYTYSAEDGNNTSITAFSNPIRHTLSLSKGLKSVKVKHGNADMEAGNSANELKDGQYYYNDKTGTLTIVSSTYSDFKIEIEHGFVAATAGQGYQNLADAIAATKDGGTVQMLVNTTVTETTNFDRSLTLDLNGQTLTVDVTGKSADGFVVNSGAELTLANSVASHGTFYFKSSSSNNDGIYVYNDESGKTASLTVRNPVHVELEGKFNSAIHTFASAGKAKLTIEDGTLIDITTTAQMKAVQLDQNSTGTMNGGEIKLTGNFENYSSNHDTVGVLIYGANGKQDSIHFVMSGGKLTVGGKNAFAQGIQVGMVNGYSEDVNVVVNGGEICADSNDGGESYAFTAYKKEYATFTMNDGVISGELTALSIDAWNNPVNLTVTGGKFSVDPSSYVAEGYKATPSGGGIWTVAKSES